MDELFSKDQYGFRKGYSALQWPLVLLEKWKHSVDKGKISGAILIDFSEAFGCLSYELKIEKLNMCGYRLNPLKLISNSLSQRQQRTKTNKSYSS